MPRRRLRTTTLWTGMTLCVLIAAAFMVSGWGVLAVQVPTPYGPCVGVNGGAFYVGLINPLWWDALWLAEPLPRPDGHWRGWNYWNVGGRSISAPLYALFLAVAVPTLLAWRFGPKPVKPGHCVCGYDLHGNTSGVCPECGAETAGTPQI